MSIYRRPPHRLDGQPMMMPSALRAEVRLAMAEERLTKADILRWVPQIEKTALSEFIETGRVAQDRMLIQLEHAWRLFKQGRLTSLLLLKKKDPKGPQLGRATTSTYEHRQPDDPLFEIEQERKLASKRLMALSREETDYLGVSQSTIVAIRHGEFPKLREATIMRVLEHERRIKRASKKPVAYKSYRVVDTWWEGDTEYRKLRKITTKIVQVKKKPRPDDSNPSQPPEPPSEHHAEQTGREPG